ncbi:Major facilitator superfamily domain, general substrate transporter [Cordyceps fumosorosea ARSEF 2679]|uniref:Major facilitator superfamily domain, general substrate transporter n=1 Tax=Cordyceps fumosorosea (strain ARSEF 2679) TaxID=1081104 RepID=A0A167TRE7_CORFA|nr:Major facilitator superfamily domain, general substrate transporter [Cordyceps fumosorosea ARSEF 2679]OAA60867.1 Major facilitator superfamily domain, general substrate transporter [Cordyceps fumosorosea ARSEF 2679]
MAAEGEPVVAPTRPTTGDVSSNSGSDSEGSGAKFNEQTNYVPRSTIITIFLACASVDLVALMDQTTLAASLYIIGASFGSTKEVSWIASGYFITSTIGQLIYGRLSDIWSRKVVLLTGLAIFFFGSLASSLAQSVLQLTVFRAFTGIGGGGLMTVAQLIVSDVVPLRERGKYQGILGAVVALANGIGPVIGGALSSKSKESWRWIFRLNLPLTILTTCCVVFIMPLKRVQGDWRVKLKAVDFIGIALSFAGMIAIILGLTWGGSEYPWKSAPVIACLAAGAAICVAFVLWQWKGPEYPLVPLHIFKSKIVNGACLTMMINGWNFVMQVYYVPTFYQLVYGYSATKSGALLLPITIVQTVSSTASGLVVHWVGRYRECILFGWLCWAIGLGLMSTLNEHTGLDKQIGYSVLIGIGVGNTMQPALIAAQAGVSRRDMAVATSFRNFIRNVGSTMGLAVCGSIINNVLRNAISHLDLGDEALKDLLRNPRTYTDTLSFEQAAAVRAVVIPAYKRGFRIIFLVGAGLAVLGFLLAFVLMPQISLSRPDDEKLKEEGRKAHEARKQKSKA